MCRFYEAYKIYIILAPLVPQLQKPDNVSETNVAPLVQQLQDILFEEGEMTENSVVRNFRITAADGKTYDTNYSNLEVNKINNIKEMKDWDFFNPANN
jgi:hypothetical protein